MIKNLNKVVKPEDQELTSTIIVNPIMASAEIETDKLDKRTKNFQKASRSPIKTDKNGVTKPFLGAKEQPVPSDPVWPKFKLEESLFEDIEIPSSDDDDDLPTQMKKALESHSIDYNEISDIENGTIYVYGLNPFTEDDLKAIYFEFSNILDSCGFEDDNFTMWFTFDIVEKLPLKEDTFNLKSTKKHSIAKQINSFLNQAKVEESLSESKLHLTDAIKNIDAIYVVDDINNFEILDEDDNIIENNINSDSYIIDKDDVEDFLNKLQNCNSIYVEPRFKNEVLKKLYKNVTNDDYLNTIKNLNVTDYVKNQISTNSNNLGNILMVFEPNINKIGNVKLENPIEIFIKVDQSKSDDYTIVVVSFHELEREPDLKPYSINNVKESLSESTEDEDKCCICGEIITGYGNNANPVCDGRCCDKCNWEKVIPARLQLYYKNKNVNESRVSEDEAGPQEYVIITADLEDKNGKSTKKNIKTLYNKDGEPYVFDTAQAANEYAQKLPEYTQYDFVGAMGRPKLSLWEEVYLELSEDDYNSNEANKHRRVDSKKYPSKIRFNIQDDGLITFNQEYALNDSGKLVKTNKHDDIRNMFISGNDIILVPKNEQQKQFVDEVIKTYNIPSFRVKTENKDGKERIIIHFADGDMTI